MQIEYVEPDGSTETVNVSASETKGQKGYCKVCGEPARSENGTVCDEHDGRKRENKDAPPRGTSQAAVRRPDRERKERAHKPGAAPTANEWTNKVFGKLLVGLTFFIATRAVKNKGIHDPDDVIADELSMTSQEAASIAAPLGRFIAPTNVAKKYGRQVIDNIDLVDAAFAMSDWWNRVQQFVNQPGKLATVHDLPINVDAKEVTNERETKQTPSGNGYGGGLDGVTGEHFVL